MIYWNNLDDKGRMMLPAGLRTGMQGTKLYITRGADTCLWMFTPELWEEFKQRILQKTSSFTEDGRVVRSHFLIPVQETEIDRTGRINISLPLRQYAGLTKECSICEGMEEHIDIWNRSLYDKYIEENASKVKAALESIGRSLQ